MLAGLNVLRAEKHLSVDGGWLAGPLMHRSDLQQWDEVVQQLLEQKAGSDCAHLESVASESRQLKVSQCS